MKARIKFKKYSFMKFIGHLDLMRYFQKAMRRAEIPIAFTEGYSPHMIMSFAQPLGVGTTSDGEYMDVQITEPIASKDAVKQLNEVMVEGVEVLSFVQIAEDRKASGMTIVAAAKYLVQMDMTEELKEQLEKFFARDEIVILKKTKRSEKEVDIRPMILDATIQEDGVQLFLVAGSEQNLKPDLVMEAFANEIQKDDLQMHFHRLDLFAKDENGELVTLESLGTEIV